MEIINDLSKKFSWLRDVFEKVPDHSMLERGCLLIFVFPKCRHKGTFPDGGAGKEERWKTEKQAGNWILNTSLS